MSQETIQENVRTFEEVMEPTQYIWLGLFGTAIISIFLIILIVSTW